MYAEGLSVCNKAIRRRKSRKLQHAEMLEFTLSTLKPGFNVTELEEEERLRKMRRRKDNREETTESGEQHTFMLWKS